MKKSEILKLVKELSAEIHQVRGDCSQTISELQLELLEIRREIERLRNQRNFNPLQPFGPLTPLTIQPTNIEVDVRWEQIAEEMKKRGTYVGDWPEERKTTCVQGCEKTPDGKCY